MNRKKKIFSLCFLAVLLCLCTVGLLVTSASGATGRNVTVTVVGGGVDWKDNEEYGSVESAILSLKNEVWGPEDTLTIVVESDIPVTSENGVIFSQKTIRRTDGSKLPITIKGWDKATDPGARPAIQLSTSVACANDYTFDNINFSFATSSVKLYAGNANVVIKNMQVANSNGVFAADNFTAAVFMGWTQDQIDAQTDPDGKFVSSITIGQGVKDTTAGRFASVGYNYATAPTTAEQAPEYRYEYADTVSFDIRPIHTRAKMIIDTGRDEGKTHPSSFTTSYEIGELQVRRFNSPVADAVMEVRSGFVYRIAGLAGGTFPKYSVGDMTINVYGGTLTDTSGFSVRGVGTNNSPNILVGNLSITIDEKNGYHTNIPLAVQSNFNGGTITGTSTLNMNAGYVKTLNGALAIGGTYNNINGGEIGQAFTGFHAGARDYRQEGGPVFHSVVTNTVYGGVFLNFCGGGYAAANADEIYNYVYGTPRMNYFYGGGAYTNGGIVDSVVNTFDFEAGTSIGLLYGGARMSASKVNNVTNYVKGGTFSSFNGASLNNAATGNVKNVLSGGVFSIDYYASNMTVTSVATEISGDVVFKKSVNFGTSSGSASSYSALITGGQFNGKVNPAPSGSFTVGQAGKTSVVMLGKSGRINLANVEGKVNFRQMEEWVNGQVYVTGASALQSQLSFSKGTGAIGGIQAVASGNNINWTGTQGQSFYGTSLLMQDRIIIKLYFNSGEVNAFGSAFNWSVASEIAGIGTISGGINDMEKETSGGVEYYCISLPGVAASNFHKGFTLTTNDVSGVKIDVMSLCQTGAARYEGVNAKTARLYKSIYNLGLEAHKRFHGEDGFTASALSGADYSGKYDSGYALDSTNFKKGAFQFAGASLELGSSVGIKFYGNYSGEKSDLSVYVNGVRLDSSYYELVEDATGYADYSFVLRVKANSFEKGMTVEVRGSGETVGSSLTKVSIPAVAMMGQGINDPVQGALIRALLAYSEAVSAYMA